MGEVYLARDLTLDRDVAIKLLPAAQAQDPEARRRLQREAQAAAKLDHPYICQVFEVGESPDGVIFIAMSYVEGETLAARLARGRLQVREALALARDVAEALGAAHAQGIVHRDLKPQNIMVTPSGRPKLLDFGIAKLPPGRHISPDTATAPVETANGAVLGTPAYMSPEQVGGRAVDGRSDLFALGAVLFEALTGRQAFPGNNMLAVAGAILHEHPPHVSSIRSDASAEIDELCARLLAKDPTDRFQTAHEAVGALRLLLPATARTQSEPPSQHPRRRQPAWSRKANLTAVGVVVGMVATSTWAYQSFRGLPNPPAEAERWYKRGTDFIREGAYHSASTALDEAIRQFPVYPLAHARQAEALAQLDDQKRATEQLLRMQDVLGDESRLPELDRLRLQGIRSFVLRDLGRAVAAYRTLVGRAPNDAGAWLDLGRAQEAAEQRADARASYDRALTLDGQLAAAHVRLASIDGQAGRREPALAAFAEAERLYRAYSNVEGETEVLLRRGMFLEARGELETARRDLERAQSLASGAGVTAQFVRARLGLGSVIATEGRLTDSEALIQSATEDARKAELWSLVADALIDIGGVLVNQSSRRDEADARVQEAVKIATERGFQRTAARATLQRAAIALQRDEPTLARDLSLSTIPFLENKGYRRLALTAMTILGRAQRDLDDLSGARATATQVLNAAQELHDDALVSLALANLSGAAAAVGDLPAALEAREKAHALNRKIGDQGATRFDLLNRAELLIELGRGSEADALILAVENGIAQGLESYKDSAYRVHYLRALSAIITGDPLNAARHARAVLSGPPAPESMVTLAASLLRYALVRRTPSAGTPTVTTATPTTTLPGSREVHYWSALEAWARRDPRHALSEARAGVVLAERVSNHEFTWRLAALGFLAARSLGQSAESERMLSLFGSAREHLARQWQAAMGPYDLRPDLRKLRDEVNRTRVADRRSGLVDQSY